MPSLDLNGNNKVVISMSQDENEEITPSLDSLVVSQWLLCSCFGQYSLWFLCLKSITVGHEGFGVGVFNVVLFWISNAVQLRSNRKLFFDHKCSKRCHCTTCVGRCASVIRQHSTVLVPFSFGRCPFLESFSVLC